MHHWPGADGVMLAGDAWGDPNGPLVLLQHGGGQTRHAWKKAGLALGKAGYYAIAIDARGHGDSDWAQDGIYSLDIMVEDLQCLVNSLSNPHPILVGASMGGVTSLVAIGEGQVDATALVLVDIAPKVEKTGVQRIFDFMHQRKDGFDTLEQVAEAIAAYQPQRKRPDDLAGLAKNVRQARDWKFVWHWDPKFMATPRNIEERTARLENCARELQLPTLLVRGGLSDVLSEDGAQTFLKTCPHSEYVNITDAGHMVAGDRNDLFGNAVIEFLSRTIPIKRQTLDN